MIEKKLKFKIYFFLKFIICCFLINIQSIAEESKVLKNTVIGDNNALIKIKIFSSLTCPHCANFHNKVVPKIKERFVDSGKVQLIFLDFPLDQAAFNAAKLIHCVEYNQKNVLLDKIYETQSNWTQGSSINEINKNLKSVVKNFGITSDLFEKCLVDESVSDKILNSRIEAHKKYSIESTPTIIINDKKLKGAASFENIKKTIEKII
jgi:protein-disulfide isomerase